MSVVAHPVIAYPVYTSMGKLLSVVISQHHYEIEYDMVNPYTRVIFNWAEEEDRRHSETLPSNWVV